MNNHIHLRRLSVLVMCAMLLVTLACPVFAAYPSHNNFISDPDNVLSDTTVSAIQSANDALYKSKEVKIAVCLTDSTGDESITDFSRTLFSKWEMCDGVLLVLDTTAQTYFAVQSVDIDDIVTNAVLSDILAANMEEEFAAGNTDRGVMKTVTALSQFMSANLPDPEGAATENTAATETDANGEPVEEEKEPSGFVKFMKAILWIILIAVILAAAIFVLAMFNDDVADLLRTYVFRRGSAQPVNREYYDDRLYGNQNAGRRNPQNPYNPAGYNGQRRPQQGQYPNQQNRQMQQRQMQNSGYDPYNDYDMQYQQPRTQRPAQGQYQGQQYRQNPNQGTGRQANPGYGQNHGGQRPAQGQRQPNRNGQYPNNNRQY